MSARDRPMVKARPVYLNLLQIRLPLPGVVSIVHRISGAVLSLFGIALVLIGLQLSLVSPDSFASLKAAVAHPLAKLVLIGFIWAYLHHFCAGIRYLFLDLDKGVELKLARQSGVIVLVASLAFTAMVGVRLW